MASRRIEILIADDEPLARRRLRTLLADFPRLHVACEAEDGDRALARMITGGIDAAFLDIDMPGMPVFSTLSSLKNPPLVVFQTAYAEYAAEAFGVDAVDYLLKPVSRERLTRCVTKLANILDREAPLQPEPATPEAPPQQIAVKAGHLIKVIPVREIFKISFEEGFSFLYTAAGKFLSDKYLNHFEELLDRGGFYRINRNQLVNLQQVQAVHPMFKGSYRVELKNGEKLEVSRRRAAGLKKRLGLR